MRSALAAHDHPAWITMASAIAGYALMVGLIFVALFVLPFLLWP